ncbi:uncharacterized protein (TIGR04222 family) [Herbihabitans rhizosphaerae]|uniref:Uncharacterized protein (TIGR04222 family) n=1 Tax=Herbihabitans rhizosphaerae TaxID=1872711 RepID=A0A4Q7L317_9PSEU|nr:TIGR04222 domain-containing membrane protein [Herbihabitans rhizosphaerae]RZS43627.1 uncharacterized protein (TIGR04222 family) [Herbihabitans rhizosphaerae]
MDEPWGVSEPAFVNIYLAAMFAPMLIGIVWGRVIRHRADRGTAFDHRQLPTAYHLGLLVDGHQRLIETIVANLVHRQVLLVDDAGRLSATGSPAGEPLEQDVLASVAKLGAPTTGEVVSDLNTMDPFHGSRALEDAKHFLARNGLIVPEAWSRSLKWTVALAYLGVFGMGLTRIVNAIRLERPVEPLLLLVVFAFVFMAIAFVLIRIPFHDVVPTRTGKAVVADARPDSLGGQGSTFGCAAAAVAIGGLAMYPDAGLMRALAQPQSAER